MRKRLNESFKERIKVIRSACNFWMSKQTLENLEKIRLYELDIIKTFLPLDGVILEIGAGTGWQTAILRKQGYNVIAIDINSCNYKDHQIIDIIEYDVRNIPFPDMHFNAIFSSNVLEHIKHIDEFQVEMSRVLKDDGIAIHVIPSSSWRIWTSLTHIVSRWSIPRAHGEHASNALTEVFYFSRYWWSTMLSKSKWKLVGIKSNDLFYTGCSVFDSRLNIQIRKIISRIIGSVCNVYVLQKKNCID